MSFETPVIPGPLIGCASRLQGSFAETNGAGLVRTAHSISSHFLLIVASNGCEKARKRAQNQSIEGSESDLMKLGIIGERGAFPWIRPEHMEPKGKPLSDVLVTMKSQQEQCNELLDKLRNGEGSLFRVRMSVNQLGRIDLYQWIYFIAQHAKRHIGQMQENLEEYRG